jgi:NAD+ synthase
LKRLRLRRRERVLKRAKRRITVSKKFSRVESYLQEFLRDEVHKSGIKNVVLGLSGGIDSAVVAVLLQRVFGDHFLSIMMPNRYSSQSSLDDANELVEKFDIRSEVVSIDPYVESYLKSNSSNKLSSLRVGNFSARVRMATLFDISARESALVIGTSNKSELLLGYGTLFGDLASAINPIGDMYKSEVFEFAKYLGVPDSIIEKPPSADLYEGQSDEADLGYTYAQLDSVMKMYVEDRLNRIQILNRGVEPQLIDLIISKIYNNQFKRKMPIVAKLTERTVGHDFLYARDVKI